MVSDALVGINGELKMFGDMIPQTENPQLKAALKQIRNQCEMSQEELYQLARQHQYYVPAAPASRQEIPSHSVIFPLFSCLFLFIRIFYESLPILCHIFY